MIKSKKQSMIVVSAFILVLLLGTTTYAFFNYTRTGSANTIKTGRIAFNADQGNNMVTLSDLFPISVEENDTITSSTPGVGSLKLHITGDTTYTDGIEYLIEAVEVTGNGNTSLPISINISYAPTEVEQGQDPNVIGVSDDEYFTNRGGNTSRYKLLSTGSISEGEDILVGYIAPGNTGIDGELTILAYLDARNIAITDTYPEGTKREVVENYSTSVCETALTGLQTASTLCADADDLQNAIENGDLTSAQIEALLNAGVINEYTDGTTSEWIGNKTVFTTEEWNALQATGVSFKVKATANEGTWVEEPAAPVSQDAIPSCPGCKFVFTGNTYYYSASNSDSEPLSTMSTFTTNGDTLVDDYTTLNVDHFLGFTFDGSGNITKAYACGINANNNDAAFCLEGVLEEQYGGSSAAIASVFAANVGVLNTAFPGCDASTSDSSVECSDSVYGHANSDGGVNVFDLSDYTCYVHSYGSANCDS